ncbi:MAG: hypothetical protein ACI4DV_07400 [Lachnospiraceae bacterium]
MLFRFIIKQTKFLLKQREALLTMTLLFWLVIINYLGNVLDFRGTDVSQMYQPMKLLVLSYNRINYNANNTLLIVMLYPFLVSMPAGFSYVKEQQTKEEIFFVARIGKQNYMISKLITAFLVTSIVFFIPLITEIIMNCVSFPLKAQGDLSNLSIYNPEYADMVHSYLGYSIYLYSPVLYAILGTLFFCMMSGIIAMFTVAVSFAISVRYRVLLLLPSFLILNFTVYFDNFIEGDVVSWYEYLLIFSDTSKSTGYLVMGIIISILLILGCYYVGKKREKY